MKQNTQTIKRNQTKPTHKSKETQTNPKKKKKPIENPKAFMIQI